jgi:DNA-binding winged helix-turn-helix (wHTH) protein
MRTVLADFERPSADQFISFGSFELFPKRHVLLEQQKPVRLGSRALDILTVLVERAGELVSKDELIARVWPNVSVEERNLSVHIAGLRKILGDGRDGHRFIMNISGRGYRFVAPISRRNSSGEFALEPGIGRPAHNLPASLTRMIGRDAITNAILVQLRQQRFVTLVGPRRIMKRALCRRGSPIFRSTGGVKSINCAKGFGFLSTNFTMPR